MPSLDLNFTSAGPLLQVEIGVSEPHFRAMIKAGRQVPQHVFGTFLIDTGASHTVVDPSLIAPLGLTPTGSAPIHTPSTGSGHHICDEYDVMLHILGGPPHQRGHIIGALPVITAALRSQGIDGLIGRDVLAECILIVNGPAGRATLAY